MRTFIAIELPGEIKDHLSCLQEQLKKTGADVNPRTNFNLAENDNTIGAGVKWVKPDNIHLTLKFLGERDEKKIEKISAILEETAKNRNVFEAELSSFGAFPKVDSPRVI